MSDIVSTARSARESLSRGLSLLQSNPTAPPEYLQAAEPIATAMGALHRIEAGSGDIAAAANEALASVRGALAMLQQKAANDPAMMNTMEAVASSLGTLFTLTQLAAAPQPPRAAAQPVQQAAPQAAPYAPPPQQAPYQPPQAAPYQPPQAAPYQPPQAAPYAPPPQPAQQAPYQPPMQAQAAPYQPPMQAQAAPYAPPPQPAQQAPYQPPVQAQQPYQPPMPAQQAPYQPPMPAQQAPYQPPMQAQQAPYQPPMPAQQAPYQPPMPAQQAPYQPPMPAQQAPYQPPVQAQPAQPAQQAQPAPAQAKPANWAEADPFAAPPAGAAAPKPQPAASGGASAEPYRGSDVPVVEAELGTHSTTNFFKGLSGTDVVDHGGLFVATYQVPKVGQTLKLRVALPGGYEFEAVGVVRWTRESRESITTEMSAPGFGLQFTHISPEARQLVYRYVRNREPLFHDDL